MATINQLIRTFEALDIRGLVEAAANDTAEDYADQNAAQMYTGLDANGQYITPPYARTTIAYKQAKGQPWDRVTLRDTGAFYRGLYMRVNGSTLESGSTDPKAAELQDKYGAEIFTIGGEFKRDYVFGPLLSRVKELMNTRLQIGR